MAYLGRSNGWFLEEGLTKEAYREHKHDVERSMRVSTWRSLVGIILDLTLWDEVLQDEGFKQRIIQVTKPWEKKEPLRYRELHGRIGFLWKDSKERYFLRVTLDTDKVTPLDCPIEAIISYRSTGFPKVAYGPEQYLYGYVLWLDYLLSLVDQKPMDSYPPFPHIPMEAWFLKENFSKGAFEKIQELLTLRRQGIEQDWQPNGKLLSLYLVKVESLTQFMIHEMDHDIPDHNRGMYHHTLEWYTDPVLLKRNHPIVDTYLKWRKKYPNMILGRAVIPVE